MGAPPENPIVRQPGEWQPKILGIICNWCSYAGADLAGGGRIQNPTDIRIISVMCTRRIDLLFLMKQSSDGPGGVLGAACYLKRFHFLVCN
ncbi:hydrogenase iron-sulfur subunit [Methanoregula sp.]|uniref:hydrogenase iron-sulfur subunit n=1 Tax=Methanoregula sp. TaxID=2052170 RepID=UPI000CB74243|nr:MAG: hypothetical protein CW742_14510 [Methanoregula sp.]